MASNFSPRNRGCNVGVSFDLADFTARLLGLLGASGAFTGPGPIGLRWLPAIALEQRVAVEYLAEQIFTKYDDSVKSSVKREAALQRFHLAERMCALTNVRFQPNSVGQPPEWLDDPDAHDHPWGDAARVFRRARQICSRILGPFPGWDRVVEVSDFGPGATTRLSRKMCHRAYKWGGSPHVTKSAVHALSKLYEANPGFYAAHSARGPVLEIQTGNKLDWVPKNYKTDRTIAIEPDWNMFLQKGLGHLIRSKLRRVGIDLNDQSVNQFLAAVGSITGELATIDLSMASDTVAYRLVEFLVREDWFDALTTVRSSVGFYLDERRQEHAVVFEKFSSMGNGATFELESLVFYSLLRAVSELTGEMDHRISVYGDDLVIPTGIVDASLAVLAHAGFQVNPDKSFSSGPFRESCGGHYFGGYDVTPFYIREPVDSIDRLFLLHNNVLRWLRRHPGICPPAAAQEFLVWIRSHAPKHWRQPRIMSLNQGDGAFIGSFAEVCPRRAGSGKKRYGWEGWHAVTLQYRRRQHDDEGTDTPPSPTFHSRANPHFASLWPMRHRKEMKGRFSADRDRRVGPLDWGPLNDFPADVPYTERWWYEKGSVFTEEPEESWWILLT